ncbi:MAG: 50S ribosomal protein L32 [Planctomycetota bacterium]|nr:50S ribosomal protein L32 [Planctomycetota bacterium]
MPNPKRRLSKSKRHKRRTHDHAKVLYSALTGWASSEKRAKDDPTADPTLPGLARCPRCNQLKLPHRVCGNCGHYVRAKKPVMVVKA